MLLILIVIKTYKKFDELCHKNIRLLWIKYHLINIYIKHERIMINMCQ